MTAVLAEHERSRAIGFMTGVLPKALLLAVVYCVAARVGLQLQFHETQATPIWPPSGIALGALLLFGSRLAPGVFLGAFAANLTDFFVKSGAASPSGVAGLLQHFLEHPDQIAMSAAIGLGNMLEALTGAYLIRRFAGDHEVLEGVRSVVIFVAATLASCVVASAVGVTSLTLGAALPPPMVPVTWFTWWLGDATGISIVTPLILAWSRLKRDEVSGEFWTKLALALLILVVVSAFVFDDQFNDTLSQWSQMAFSGWLDLTAFQTQGYLLVPILLWIVFRFGHRGGTLGVTIASAIAVIGTIRGHGIFASPQQHLSLLVLQGYNAVMSVTVLLIGSALQERRRAQQQTREILETRIAESIASLRETEERFRRLVQGVTDYAILTLDPQGCITDWNTGAERIYGYAPSEIVGQHISRFFTEVDRDKGVPGQILSSAMRPAGHEHEGWRVRKDGSRFWANSITDAIYDDADNLVGFTKITRDMTERIAVEERLRQAQKIETLGQLTGGIAHDFNNLLTAVIGSIETLQRRIKTDAPELRRYADTAMRGAERGAALTRKLVAFARRQPLEPKPVELNWLIDGLSDLVNRTLGETIVVEKVLADGLWWISADANELENAILNLVINARDAMPNGGKLTIETANVYLDDGHSAVNPNVTSGQYVMIAVSDTGTGMTKEVVSKAFEPFFTTKPVGEGTGLGLSQVHGFVKQSGGDVEIYSEPGKGTTVKVYLPRLAFSQVSQTVDGSEHAVAAAEGETILLVEDDEDVIEHNRDALSELGYRVLTANDATGALGILETERQVQLLFTDVGLPGALNGQQLADEAQRRQPSLKVLLTTGYAPDAIVHRGKLDPDVALLAKPFTYRALARKIRQVLEG